MINKIDMKKLLEIADIDLSDYESKIVENDLIKTLNAAEALNKTSSEQNNLQII